MSENLKEFNDYIETVLNENVNYENTDDSLEENLEMFDEELELEEEEKEVGSMTELLNLFTIAYNKLNKTKGSLLDGINFSDKTSINDKIILFSNELKYFKEQNTNLSNSGKYILEIDNDKFQSDSIILLLIKLLEHKSFTWKENNWKIKEK